MRMRTVVNLVLGLRKQRGLAFSGRSFSLSSPVRQGLTLSLIVLAIVVPRPASASTGIIAFLDDCTGLLYAMRGDGTGRISLPLPQLPAPAADYRYRDPWVVDVTTSGPLTVVYYVGIARRNTGALVDFGLFAVQLDDVNGSLLADPSPVRLTLPDDVGFGVNPNIARMGSFSPATDRLAIVASSSTSSVLMTARVDRDDSTLKMTGLSDLVVVGDLYAVGRPDPTIVGSNGFTGFIDYSPDGSHIVASIYYDLWIVNLLSDNTYGGASLVTENTDGVAEWKPSYSPDGAHIAYTAGPITSSGGVSGQDLDIYALDLRTGAVTRVTNNSNKGAAASGRHNAMWTPDGTGIGFSAFTAATPRHSSCSALVNSELFVIRADGSNTASQITNTNKRHERGSVAEMGMAVAAGRQTPNNPMRCGYRGPGALIRVHHPSQPDESRTTLITGLIGPASVVIGPDGKIYVTNRAVPTPNQDGTVQIRVGEVLRFDPPE